MTFILTHGGGELSVLFKGFVSEKKVMFQPDGDMCKYPCVNKRLNMMLSYVI